MRVRAASACARVPGRLGARGVLRRAALTGVAPGIPAQSPYGCARVGDPTRLSPPVESAALRRVRVDAGQSQTVALASAGGGRGGGSGARLARRRGALGARAVSGGGGWGRVGGFGGGGAGAAGGGAVA